LLFVDSCVEEEVREAMAEVVMVLNWKVLGALIQLQHDGPVEELDGAAGARLVIVVEDLISVFPLGPGEVVCSLEGLPEPVFGAECAVFVGVVFGHVWDPE
jgi:hypothetical protein